MKKSSAKSKQILRDRTRLEWVLFVALLLIALLLLASRYQWWPWNTSNDNLGTAFYAVRQKDAKSLPNTSSSNSTSNVGGSSNNGGSNGSSGGGTGSGSGGSSPSSSSILSFAAKVDTGNTKEQTNVEASGLDQNCALLVNSSAIGKQEVCTYTEGDKLVTVTYLNDHVISASRSGF